jgi:putative endonuclease
MYSVYILSNFARTVLYIGVTNNLERRVWEHRFDSGSRFTTKYKCHLLMYFEEYPDIKNAIAREKQLKNWQRKWKIEMIRKENPDLLDLAKDWY